MNGLGKPFIKNQIQKHRKNNTLGGGQGVVSECRTRRWCKSPGGGARTAVVGTGNRGEDEEGVTEESLREGGGQARTFKNHPSHIDYVNSTVSMNRIL